MIFTDQCAFVILNSIANKSVLLTDGLIAVTECTLIIYCVYGLLIPAGIRQRKDRQMNNESRRYIETNKDQSMHVLKYQIDSNKVSTGSTEGRTRMEVRMGTSNQVGASSLASRNEK